MSGQGQRRSWSSLISLDGIRSLTRAGSRQGDVASIKNCQTKLKLLDLDPVIRRAGSRLSKYSAELSREKFEWQLGGIDLEAGDCPEHDHKRHHLFESLSNSFARVPEESMKTYLSSEQSLFDTGSTRQDMVSVKREHMRGSVLPSYPMRKDSLLSNPSTKVAQPGVTRPCVFSFEDSKIIENEGFRVRKYPTGVNPLGCHPQVRAFAGDCLERLVKPFVDKPPFTSLPVRHVSPPLPLIQPNRSNNIDADLNSLDDLGRVPISSPSIDNPKNYARYTPSPARSSYVTSLSAMGKSNNQVASVTRGYVKDSQIDRTQEHRDPSRSKTGLNIRQKLSSLKDKTTEYAKLSEPEETGFAKVRNSGRIERNGLEEKNAIPTPEKRNLFGRFGRKKENVTPRNDLGTSEKKLNAPRTSGKKEAAQYSPHSTTFSPSPLRKEVHSSDSLNSLEHEQLKYCV